LTRLSSREGWQEHTRLTRHKIFTKTLVPLKKREVKLEEKKGKKNPVLVAVRKDAMHKIVGYLEEHKN
jgi:hypothetical protein